MFWQEIADRSYKDHLIQKKWEIICNYKELVEAARAEMSNLQDKLELIIRDVAELPDRTSPEDWPEALIVTSDELEEILTQHLGEKCGNQEQSE